MVIIDGCEHGLVVGAKVRQCIKFPSGVRAKDVKPVEDSFGEAAPPAGTEFEDTHTPKPGECSVATHDRYWVRAVDGRVYRTWHPSETIDVETGKPCYFGHEHGDDPRKSPLYQWAGGVPFGITNRAAMAAGHHRHEDHYGHKVVVQNDWEAAIGNPPDNDKPIIPVGFRCYWLSKVHQGTHSGDALGHNEHEYQNNIMCDDGAQRHPDAGFEANAGPERHTEGSVKTLTVWGPPGAFKACDGLVLTPAAGDGREPPPGADTNREIKCAKEFSGWMYKDIPTPTVSETGDTDYAGDGIDELWKPWMTVVNRAGSDIFLSSAYYVVRNPARLYNPDGAFVPKRDVNGDGTVDDWIPTLEVCLAHPELTPCKGLPAFPQDVPKTEWWRLPGSPFNGTIRVIHPKGIGMYNGGDRAEFCTDYRGIEQANDPGYDADGLPSCLDGQILQRVATTNNRWGDDHASWGPGFTKGHVGGSTVNSRQNKTIGAGYGHEWVKFFNAPGVHAPN